MGAMNDSFTDSLLSLDELSPSFEGISYAGNLEVRYQAARIWNRKNSEQSNANHRRWNHIHRAQIAQFGRVRRARKVDAEGSFTAEEFRELCREFEDKCSYCYKELPLTADHIIPLIRGGTNYIWNILPACKSCNSSKGAKTVEEFLHDSK